MACSYINKFRRRLDYELSIISSFDTTGVIVQVFTLANISKNIHNFPILHFTPHLRHGIGKNTSNRQMY